MNTFIWKTPTHLWGEVNNKGIQAQIHILIDEDNAKIEFYKMGHSGDANFYRNKPNVVRCPKDAYVPAINKFFGTEVIEKLNIQKHF